jgi:hypothetical protein
LEHKLEYQQNMTTIQSQIEQMIASIEALKSELLVIEMTIAEV